MKGPVTPPFVTLSYRLDERETATSMMYGG